MAYMFLIDAWTGEDTGKRGHNCKRRIKYAKGKKARLGCGRVKTGDVYRGEQSDHKSIALFGETKGLNKVILLLPSPARTLPVEHFTFQ